MYVTDVVILQMILRLDKVLFADLSSFRQVSQGPAQTLHFTCSELMLSRPL